MSGAAKPRGAANGWERLGTEYPLETPWLRLRRDRVLRHGEEIQFTYVESPGAVGVVPLTDTGEVVLIRQYRYAADECLTEIPAGGMHDAQGRSLEEVARCELQQEIGATCRALEYIARFYTAVGQTDQAYHVFLALGVSLDGEQELEPTEDIELWPVPVSEALRMARAGEITDGTSALALLLCEPRLRELGCL
jgi:ADP-ribose pyrophosphatase